MSSIILNFLLGLQILCMKINCWAGIGLRHFKTQRWAQFSLFARRCTSYKTFILLHSQVTSLPRKKDLMLKVGWIQDWDTLPYKII